MVWVSGIHFVFPNAVKNNYCCLHCTHISSHLILTATRLKHTHTTDHLLRAYCTLHSVGAFPNILTPTLSVL